MPTCYVLVGLPASGKSTWRARFLDETDEQYITLSSDDIIDQLCEEAGVTYNEGFEEFAPVANKMYDRAVQDAFSEKDNVIIDRTNMSKKSRKRYMDLGKKHGYRMIAVDLSFVDRNEINIRMKKRFEATGKSVPDFVVNNMMKSYQRPSKEEGFDQIVVTL